MRGRNPDKFILKPKDKLALQELLRDGQTPLVVARRAQILLGRAEPDCQVIQLSDSVDRDAATIWRVCERYRQKGLDAALYDASRSGRPPVFSLRRTRRH